MIRCFFIASALMFFAACRPGATHGSDGGGYDKVVDLRPSAGDTLDFGTLPPDGEFDFRLGLRNNDTVPVVILSVGTSCGCTAAYFDKKPVIQGDTALLNIRYDARGQFGRQFKNITILSTADNEPKVVYFWVDVK